MRTMWWLSYVYIWGLARSQAQFELMNMGIRCAEGLIIDDIDECLLAAQSIGLQNSEVDTCGYTAATRAPTGCYLMQAGCCPGVWFNSFESTATGKRIDSRGICRRPRTTTTTTAPPSVFHVMHDDAQRDAGLIEDAVGEDAGKWAVKNTSTAIVAALALKPNMADNSSGISQWKIPIPYTNASLIVPTSDTSEKLEEGDTLILRVAVVKPSELSSINALELQDNSSDLSIEGLISVDLFLATQPGRPLRIGEMRNPILITIPVNMSRSMDAVCAFFDFDEGRWSRRGVTRVSSTREFICSVEHLSLFGAIKGLLEKTLKCGTVSVLSPEGLSVFNRHEWWLNPASLWSTWVFFLHAVIILACTVFDKRTAGLWRDEWFIAVDPEVADELNKGSIVETVFLPIAKFKGLVYLIHQRRLTFDAAVASCVHLIQTITAAHMGVKPNQFRKIRTQRDAGQDTKETVDDMYQRLRELTFYHHRTCFSQDACLRANFFLFLRVLHPWLSMTLHSIQLPSSTRALMLMAGVVAAMFTSALLFVSGSPPQSHDSPLECLQGNLWDQLGQAVAASIISGLLASVPLIFFASLHGQQFCAIHDARGLRSKIRQWRVRDKILWLLCTVYIFLCFFYVVVFAANVSVLDQEKWVVNSALRVFQQTILLPFAFAATFSLASRMMSRFPAIVDESRARLERIFPADLNEKSEGQRNENTCVECEGQGRNESQIDPLECMVILNSPEYIVTVGITLEFNAVPGNLSDNLAFKGALIRPLATTLDTDMSGATVEFAPCSAENEGAVVGAVTRRISGRANQDLSDPKMMENLSELMKQELGRVDALEARGLKVLSVEKYRVQEESAPGNVCTDMRMGFGSGTQHNDNEIPKIENDAVECKLTCLLENHSQTSNALSKTCGQLPKTRGQVLRSI